MHAWSEFDQYWIPWASTKSFASEGADGKLSERHVGVKSMISTTIWTNQAATPIFTFARAGSPPKLSPSGTLIAFTVSGEVFPIADTFCDLLVIDLKGAVVQGNAQAAISGHTHGRKVITEFSWLNESEIRIVGVDLDVLGGKKPFARTISVFHRAPQAPVKTPAPEEAK